MSLLAFFPVLIIKVRCFSTAIEEESRNDFEIDIDFVFIETGTTETMFAQSGSNNSALRILSGGNQVVIRPGNQNTTKNLNETLVSGTRYQWRLKRTGNNYDLTNWEGTSLIDSVVTTTSNWTVGWIGKQNNGTSFGGQLVSWRLSYPTDTAQNRFYDADASGGTGNVMPETETSFADATLSTSIWPSDNSQWVDLGGGGGDISISATSQALSITEQSATVQQDVDISISSSTSSISITEQSSTISLGSDISISSNVDNLTFTSFNSIISVGNDIVISGTSQNISITENAATVQQDSNISINTSIDSLIITENNASIVLTGPINISANLDSLVLTPYSAGVGISVLGDFQDFETNISLEKDFSNTYINTEKEDSLYLN